MVDSPQAQAMTGRFSGAFILLGIFIALALSAWNARMPDVWLLENVVLLVVAPFVYLAWRDGSLSRNSILLLLAFLCLHELGTHYTYSHVPYDQWFRQLAGETLSEQWGWQRNHYDRAVHFAFGLLATCPIREVLIHRTGLAGGWSFVLPFTLIMTMSTGYELIEWGAALLFGGELGMEYLGIQGDVWDAHKDMALAAGGALTALLACALARMLLHNNDKQ